MKTISQQNLNQPLAVLVHRLAPVLRGWVNYFRHGTSKAAFDYLRHYTWRRVIVWLRRKHPRATWKWLRRHHLAGWWPTDRATRLFDPMTVPVTRYRYRAANIRTPWQRTSTNPVMGYAAAPGGAYRSGRGHRVPLDRQGDREDQERGRVSIKRTITYDVDLFCWEDDPADVEMFRWSAEGGISGERSGVECTATEAAVRTRLISPWPRGSAPTGCGRGGGATRAV